MENNLKKYKQKTRKSFKLFEKSKKLHVNGVHHNIRYFEPYPFVVKSSSSKFLKDVDGNSYTDYWMGHWSLILGHSNSSVKTKVQNQIKKGWMYGAVNEATLGLSELIQKTIPVAQKIRYASTGTEATMYAVRLARSYTGKKIIAKIDGGWHGYTSDLLKTVNWPFDQPESSGLTGEQDIVSIPYNNLEKSIQILNSVKGDLAGVIAEPLLGGGGCIPATKDYLLGLQEFVKKNNSIFLLDEIVTGFRFRFGCLYPTMRLDPDIITLGKIVGGGFPIGVICGKDEIMDYANTHSHKKAMRSYIGGGTFSANPISMTAGHANLAELKKRKNAIYPKIDSLGKSARKELAKVFDGKVVTTGMGSLFMTHFVKDGIKEIKNAEDASKCDIDLHHKYHFDLISENGIFFLPGKLGAISDVHTKEDIKSLISASTKFAEKLRV